MDQGHCIFHLYKIMAMLWKEQNLDPVALALAKIKKFVKLGFKKWYSGRAKIRGMCFDVFQWFCSWMIGWIYFDSYSTFLIMYEEL